MQAATIAGMANAFAADIETFRVSDARKVCISGSKKREHPVALLQLNAMKLHVPPGHARLDRLHRRAVRPLHHGGVPEHVRSDSGPEFIAQEVQDWIAAVGAKTAYIAPGSPWENSFVESFNASLRDELLNAKSFARSSRRGVSSKAVDVTSTRSGLTHRLATGRWLCEKIC
jgi:hypothetical protein